MVTYECEICMVTHYSSCMKPDLVDVHSRSDENVSDLRSQDRGGGGGKPWRNKDRASWRQDNGDTNAKGKWGGRADRERTGGEKWNSRGDDERRGKSWKDSSFGGGSGRSV